MKVLYTAEVTMTGGRSGMARSRTGRDRRLDLSLLQCHRWQYPRQADP